MPNTPISVDEAVNEALRPYVPRLLVDWLRSGDTTRVREVPGTLAFADISGFTKLTERLARKGKVGAEEMNDLLDDVFTELLEIAYRDGAGLIKWGGDAVLLLFEGAGSRRARLPSRARDAPCPARTGTDAELRRVRVAPHVRRHPHRRLPLLPRRRTRTAS